MNTLPNWNTQAPLISSMSAGAEAQILLLPVTAPNSTFYIILTSPRNNLVSVELQGTQPAQLLVGSKVVHHSSEWIGYVSEVGEEAGGLQVEMDVYSGDGGININYCGGLASVDYYQPDSSTGTFYLSASLI